MFKTIYLLLILCAFNLTSMAQPVLDSSNTNPVAGNVFIWATCNGLSNTGLAGAGQTWDLTTLTATNSTTYSCTSSLAAPFLSSSVKLASINGDIYYNTSASSLEASGMENSSGVQYVYSDNEKLLNFPFQMGDSFTDTWANTFDNGLTYFRNGTSEVTADGHGTVMLPIGNFSNVLRVKTIQTYQDSVPGLGVVYSYVNTSFAWYLPGQHQPIASLSSLVNNGTTPVLYGQYLASLVTAIDDVSSSKDHFISISPNPAIHDVLVSLTESISSPVFILTDMTGREISLNVTRQAVGTYSISPIGISSGLYVLRAFVNGKYVASGKVQFSNE